LCVSSSAYSQKDGNCVCKSYFFFSFFFKQETKGHRKVLASAEVNMKKYASATPAQYEVTLKLKPLSVKVVEATLKLNLSCVFLKEGKAT